MESDNMLIQKLINVAGISNDNLLSDEENLRGRALLLEAQAISQHSNPECTWKGDFQSKLSLAEHIARLSIAVAPHKRLSQEILELIFVILSEEKRYSIELPPEVYKVPWLLGQVCSRWRTISRSMPDLWGTIDINMEDDFMDPGFGRKDHKIPLKMLECAAQVLPDVSRILLRLRTENPTIIATALCPFMNCVSGLDWNIRAKSTNQQYPTQVLLPGSFSRLQRLSLYIEKPAGDLEVPITFPPDLFGNASKLEDLIFTSNVPDFLMIDIPWHQLCYLNLKLSDECIDDYTQSIWLDFRQRDPFQSMVSLKRMALDLSQAFLPLVLSFDFPWKQLIVFRLSLIHIRTGRAPSKNDFQLIMHTLQKCTALINYTFIYETYPTDVVTFSATYPPIALPSLETIFIPCSVPSSMIISLSSGGNLQSIGLKHVSLDDLHLILLQCPLLIELSCTIKEGNNKSLRDVVMRHLRDMTLTIPYPSMFPLLSTPSLDSLTIWVENEDEGDFFEQILDFIVHLNTKLQKFHCDLSYPAERPAQLLVALLSVLEYCVCVHIDQIVLPRDVLVMIATRKLLPCVKDLIILINDSEAFVNMVKHRVEEELSQLGRVTLQDVSAHRSSDLDIDILDKNSQLEELNRMYGIHSILF